MLFGTLWKLRVLPHGFDLPWDFYSMWPAYHCGNDAARDDDFEDDSEECPDTLIFETTGAGDISSDTSSDFRRDPDFFSCRDREEIDGMVWGSCHTYEGKTEPIETSSEQEEGGRRWLVGKLMDWENKDAKRVAKSMRSRRSMDAFD